MTDEELARYIRQMLHELAELADGRSENIDLGTLAFKLRLLAGNQRSTEPEAQSKRRPLH